MMLSGISGRILFIFPKDPSGFQRYSTKPRWLPIAKTKLFRIPKRPVQPIEDAEQLKQLNSNYNTHMRAIRKLFVDQYTTESLSQANAASEMGKREEEISLQKAILENTEWNKKVAEDREIRLQREAVERQNLILQTLDEREKSKEEEKREALATLQRIKHESKKFITRDKLDEAIENALSQKINYNFALNMRGEVFAPAPEEKVEVKKIVAKSQ